MQKLPNEPNARQVALALKPSAMQSAGAVQAGGRPIMSLLAQNDAPISALDRNMPARPPLRDAPWN